ncbi:hypothetical protein AC1031_011808 [Aphanomyces cochlioides]|nr:hypothetical protein AC1031_011808 [Aphanomyces cochlioides]
MIFNAPKTKFGAVAKLAPALIFPFGIGMAATATRNFFTPIKVGANLFANRIFIAPLSRRSDARPERFGRNTTQRVSGGLLITECTVIAPGTSAFHGEPGGACQGRQDLCAVWHAGRAAYPDLNDDAEIVAPSVIAVEGTTHTPNGKVPNVQSRELRVDELSAIVQTFATAAKNLLALTASKSRRQWLSHRSIPPQWKQLAHGRRNARAAVGADRVGIRFSSLNSYNSMVDSDPAALSEAVAKVAQKHNLAYFHAMRADFDQVQTGDVVPIFREHFKNTLIVNMGYTKDEANAGIADGLFDAVAFGTSFLANPDLPARFEKGAELNAPDPSTFYVGDAKGYTDYPFLS